MKDLSVSGSVSGPDSGSGNSVGGVVGYNDGGRVENCHNIGEVSGNSYVGGVVGSNSFSATVTNCYNTGKVSGSEYVGGVVGDNHSSGTVENCYNIGEVSGNYVGGVVGYNISSVTNCYNTGSEYVGGVVGVNFGNVTGCYNTGKVTGTDDYVGGVVGWNASGANVENCHNIGEVSGNRYVGGVVGDNGGGSVTNSYNIGEVSGNRYVGGVVGWNIGSGNVKNCYNTGSVSGPDSGTGNRVGGVVGYNDGGSVTNSYNTGEVSGKISVGGVVGDNNGSVTGCYFLKTADVNENLSGIGGGSGSGDAAAKDGTAFHSGEVAWLLENGQADGSSQVWGQNIKDGENDNYPQLRALDADTPQVYKVAFMNDSEEHDAKYANSGMTVDLPATEPTKEGYTFSYWQDKAGTQVTEPISVNSDTTYYAKWTPVAEPDPDPEPTPEPEEPPYSGKYSYEVFTSVGAGGTITVDRYATEGDTVTIQVTPDQAYKLDDLSVTANGKDVELTANGDGTYSFTMPSADVKITATFAEDLGWTEPEPEEPSTDVSDIFIDVAPNAWYKDAVQYAYAGGLMTGVSDTEFAPEATTTRAMIVSTLARLENVTSAESAGFADVSANDWYATAVNWAANVGVVNGYEDGTFRPNQPITREQLAAILMNYAACIGQDVSNRADLTSYTDQPSTWAEEAMSWAVAEGLVSGVTADQLQPQGNATRAQVAAILQRFLDN